MKSVAYFIFRYLFRRQFLIAASPNYECQFKFKIEDVVGRSIFKTGKYEEELTSLLCDICRFNNDDILLDVGANIGWYSVILSKLMPASSRTYAFEPDPLNFKLLTHNCKLNNVTNIECVNAAVGESIGTATLHLYPSKNLGRHSLIALEGNSEKLDVKMISLDSFFEEQQIDLTRIKFLKIDIEGFEYSALLGAKKILTVIPMVLMEFSPDYMKKGGFEPKELIELIRTTGLKPNCIQKGKMLEVSLHELANSCEQRNILWTRSTNES